MSDGGGHNNDIEQGVGRCSVCFGVLPCRDHPRPPKLSFAGGTHFDDKSTQYKKAETPDGAEVPTSDSSGADNLKSPFDDAGWPLRDSPVDARASEQAGEKGPELQRQLPGDVPVPTVSQDNAQDKVVYFPGATTLDTPVDRLFEQALKHGLKTAVVVGFDNDGNEYFAYSTSDSWQINFLLDRAKIDVMTAWEDADGYPER